MLGSNLCFDFVKQTSFSPETARISNWYDRTGISIGYRHVVKVFPFSVMEYMELLERKDPTC